MCCCFGFPRCVVAGLHQLHERLTTRPCRFSAARREENDERHRAHQPNALPVTRLGAHVRRATSLRYATLFAAGSNATA